MDGYGTDTEAIMYTRILTQIHRQACNFSESDIFMDMDADKRRHRIKKVGLVS